MKKVISVVAALALAGAMATSALAADAGYTKDQLKSRLAIQAQNYGATQYETQAGQIIDALTDAQAKALDLDTLKGIADNGKSAVDNKTSGTELIKAVNDGVADLESALKATGADVKVAVTPKIDANGMLTVDANITVNGTNVSAKVEKQTKAGESGGSQTGGGTNDSVIKATGLNTTGAAAAAMAVTSVLGVAAVKARKLGE